MDEQTSLLVLVPAGISAIIEVRLQDFMQEPFKRDTATMARGN